jgi:hypothetical protein
MNYVRVTFLRPNSQINMTVIQHFINGSKVLGITEFKLCGANKMD